MAEAMVWVSRITAVAFQMVLPVLAGHYADRYFGTRFLVLVGTAVGLVLGFWQLLAIARKNQTNDRSPPSDSGDDTPSDLSSAK